MVDETASALELHAYDLLGDISGNVESIVTGTTDDGGDHTVPRAEDEEVVIPFKAVDLDRFHALVSDVKTGAVYAFICDCKIIAELSTYDDDSVESSAAVDTHRGVDVVLDLVVAALTVDLRSLIIQGEGADDEAVIVMSAELLLRQQGYRVSACRDGAEALKKYRLSWKNVDLVILDMIMPKMNGKETFMEMRRINPDIKALFMSGYSLENDARNVIDEGVCGFIEKPFQESILISRVAKALSIKK